MSSIQTKQLLFLYFLSLLALSIFMLAGLKVVLLRYEENEHTLQYGLIAPNTLDAGDYGPFTEGMRLQRAFSIPNYRLGDGQPDYERIWDFMASYGKFVWDAARPNLPSLILVVESGFDRKHFIKFANADSECHYVTMGIGGSIEAEKPFQEHYPQCYFLGVDPDGERNRPIFESLGGRAKFVEAAVHLNSGKQIGHFLREDKERWQGYYKEEVEHTGIDELLAKHFNATMIDLLSLDVEGTEYSLLSWLINNASGGRRQQSPIICQANIEFHHPIEEYSDMSTSYNYTTFFAELAKLMETHAMLNSGQATPLRHFHAHFVNVVEKKCLEKILPPPPL